MSEAPDIDPTDDPTDDNSAPLTDAEGQDIPAIKDIALAVAQHVHEMGVVMVDRTVAAERSKILTQHLVWMLLVANSRRSMVRNDLLELPLEEFEAGLQEVIDLIVAQADERETAQAEALSQVQQLMTPGPISPSDLPNPNPTADN